MVFHLEAIEISGARYVIYVNENAYYLTKRVSKIS